MQRLAKLARPRDTVRLRLTLLYGALFLVSGAALLGITYVLMRHSTGNVVLFSDRRAVPADVEQLERLPVPDELQGEAQRRREQAREQRDEQLREQLIQSGIALAIMAVVSIGLGWLVAGRVLAPREAAYEAQRRFVANASHELRTPLAMMRTSLDVAAAKPGPAPPELRTLDGKLREGLDRAERLLESFLALARAERGALPERAPVSLSETVAAALDRRRDAIAASGIELRRSLRDGQVVGSRTLLAQMVDNVVDNAIRHNEQRGWMAIETVADGGAVRLVVESGGARLDERELRELAQPFRRLRADRTGSDDGVGLGLSIVAAITSAHGGTLALRAREQGGLRVEIELPGAPA